MLTKFTLKVIKSLLFYCVLSISIYANENINIGNIVKQNDKPTLLFFHMRHCPYCERMIHLSFKNKDIQSIIQKDFNFIDININKSGKIKYHNFAGKKYEFATFMDINFYPTVIFLDHNGDIVYTARGYRNQKIFYKILSFIKTKSYNDMDFTEYK